jgi:phosphoinositide-3-kinase regulatory subunit 4
LTKSASSSSGQDNDRHQLKDKGISAKDEKKIVAMKEFILKQAHAARA